MNAICDGLHPVVTFAAGSAFPARFMLEEMNGLVDDPVHADSVVDHDHGSRPEVRAERANGCVIHRCVEDFIIHNDQRRGCASRHDGFNRAAFLNTAAVFIDQLAEGCSKG